ncbi:hypothetical protein FNV43_RR15623 [Rhamnella rubrinervis]|uniref:Uncharacterized protein n=1 Tax=Rhamnella rubrinervis TaxID=2594499 RepID=A0A8K0E848_9ROSA|nr:hypothetical protein FNV43_RR15623 [Rhamnella rubrinervis]
MPPLPHQTSMEEPPLPHQEEEEALNKILRSILEIYDNLPAKIRHQLNMEDLLNKHKAGNSRNVNFTTSSRGLRGPLEDLFQKLERFIIRALDPGSEVVKDEDQPPKR